MHRIWSGQHGRRWCGEQGCGVGEEKMGRWTVLAEQTMILHEGHTRDQIRCGLEIEKEKKVSEDAEAGGVGEGGWEISL